MNEEHPPTESIGTEPIEARIVAWVLGEASAFEAAELERLCEEQPGLRAFHHRMLVIHGLLGEAAATGPDTSWKLPAGKRKVLEELTGGELQDIGPAREKRVRRNGRRALFSIAACLMLTLLVSRLFEPMKYAVAVREEAAPTPVDAPDLEELKKLIRDQEDNLEERRKVLSTIMRTKGIVYYGEESPYRYSAFDDGQEAKSAHETYHELEQEKMQLESTIQNLLKYSSDQLMTYAAGFDLPGNNIKSLHPEYLEQKRRVQALEAEGLGNHHPTVQAQNEILANQKRQLDESIVSLRDTLQAQLELAELRLERAGELRDERKEETIKRGIDTHDYVDAKRDFEADQERLQELKRRYAELSGEERGGEGDALASHAMPASPPAPATAMPMGGVRPEITSGLRSGDAAVTRESIDAILNNPSRAEEGRLEKAERLRRTGRYADAEETLKDVVAAGGSAKDQAVDEVRRGLYIAEGAYNLGKYDEAKNSYEEVLQKDPYNAAARRGLERLASARSDYYRAAYDHTRAELLMQVDKAWGLSIPAEDESTFVKPAEEQAPVSEHEEIASENPYSTFSLHVSDASFRIAKAAMEKGGRPDPAGVRIEQFYNAVDYGDPAPSHGERVVGFVEQCAHPLLPGRNLVRVAVKTAASGRGGKQPLRLTLLVDQSGSMAREDRAGALAVALRELGGLLTERDEVTVIGFSRTPRLLVEAMRGGDAGKLAETVRESAAEGGTNLEEALKLASELAVRRFSGDSQNRVVLLTDGAANLGDAEPSRLAAQVKALRQQGIAFDVAGIGLDELNDRLLSELVRHGDGRYHLMTADDDGGFALGMAGAFRPAAENVKVQVRFNPERVSRYKLIGFEDHRLAQEDFRNDAVDAAELAAAEAGVALYQVELLPGGSGEIGELSVRFRDAATRDMVERTWPLPHDPAAPAFDEASPSMKLAGLAMLAGEKLRGGPHAAEVNFQKLAPVRAEVRQYYGDRSKAAAVLWMARELER